MGAEYEPQPLLPFALLGTAVDEELWLLVMAFSKRTCRPFMFRSTKTLFTDLMSDQKQMPTIVKRCTTNGGRLNPRRNQQLDSRV